MLAFVLCCCASISICTVLSCKYQHLHCVVQAGISICTVLLCKYQQLHCVVQILADALCCWQASAFAQCCCASISICTVLYKYQQLQCVVCKHQHLRCFCAHVCVSAFFVCVVVQVSALHYVVSIMLTGVRHMKLLVWGSCLFLLYSYRCQTYEVTGQGIMPFSVALLQVSDT